MEDGASILSGQITIIDEKHTLLLNHVYDNNHDGNLKYLEKIEKSRLETPAEKSLDLDYAETKEKEWISSWKIRTSTSDEILSKIIKKIQVATKGVKIESMSLNEKGIYIGKYKLDEVEYPIAVYSEKATIDKITKVQVSEVGDLDKDENKRYIKSEETFIKYLVIAFYEEGNSEPVLIMQIEKFDISKLQDTKSIWLKFLNVLEQTPNAEASNEQAISVLDPSSWQAQNTSTGCCDACKSIVSTAGAPWTGGKFQMTTEGLLHTSLTINTKESALGLKAIDYSLDTLKKPMVVGVNHTLDYKVALSSLNGQLGYPNDDETTDHYVVIVGRGYDEIKGKRYYLFYDVAKNDAEKCTSEGNKLFLQADGKLCEEDTCIRERFWGSDRHSEFYTVSLVLTNTK